MSIAYLLLGSNLGEREKNIEAATRELENLGLIIQKKSSLYNTAPWGFYDQPDFLNIALECVTTFSPVELLKEIKRIEKKLGRKRTIRYGPRVIDIDIIFYDNIIIKTKFLTIPHPLMHKRRFVLEPICEIAPDFVHPELNLSVRELLDALL